MTTYRDDIRQLDSIATPGPWFSEGELYGVREEGAFRPLGFAPHRPLDSRLIVVYRSAVMQLIGAVDAIDQLAMRSVANPSVPAGIGMRQIIGILDSVAGTSVSYRDALADLDRRTTPPPWDPGHLVLGMELDMAVRASLGIATPRAGDCQLIAVCRSAVPRALGFVSFAEQTVSECGRRDGSLSAEGAAAVAEAVAAFDRYDALEGSGTGTV